MNRANLTARLVLLLAVAAALPAQSLTGVFARLDKSAQQFKALSADIKRNVHTAVINDDSVDSGTFKLKRDKPHETRALIDFTAPDAKTVSLDASNVSIYYPKIKTVQIYDVGDKRGMIDQFLLLGFGASSDELKEAYEITWVGAENIDGKPTGHIQLVPKSKDLLTRLKRADLWISDATGLPAQQKFVTSAAGDFMLITYSNVKYNPSLSDGALKLNYPKGVQIQHPGR